MCLTVGFLVVFLTLFYCYCTKKHNYWKDRGVPQTKPTIFLGDIPPYPLTKTKTTTFLLQDIYDGAKGKRYVGFYRALTPTLMIRDPELIKRITVKDADHFENHDSKITDEADSYLSKHPVLMRGQRWKDIRALLSPSFTPAKLKGVFPLMLDSTETLIEYLQKFCGNSLQSIELMQFANKFANDVITSYDFGIKIDSLGDPENEFNKKLRMKLGVFTFWQKLKFGSYMSKNIFTNILIFFKCSLFSKSVYSFVDGIVNETISVREREGIVRPDMIQLLMQARQNSQSGSSEDLEDTGTTMKKSQDTKKLSKRLELSIDDIAAQPFIFVMSALYPTSHVFSFIIFELTLNEDVQDRLRKEIIETLENNNGKIDYGALIKMKYLDMVVLEVLRKWPDSPFLDREVSKPYTIEPERPGEKPVHLNVGDVIWAPAYGLQHDPQYYPQPEKFIPERFSDENKANINPFTYLPLGFGPRKCFGFLWSFLAIKMFAFYLVRNFQFVPVEKTRKPFEFGSGTFIYSKNGLWVGVKSLKPTQK